MSGKETTRSDAHFRATEDAAYNAFREWPVFLMLRRKELEAHLSPADIQRATPSTPIASVESPNATPIPPLDSSMPAPTLPSSLPTTGVVQLPIASITWDGGTQVRVQGVSQAVVREYAVRLRDGEQPPPIIVFHDGQTYWPADGFHRAAAAQMNGETTIAAEIQPGTRRDALLSGIRRNSAHGLRYSHEDKRNAIRLLVSDPQCSAWSDRQIARHCGVDHKTVAAVRKEIAASAANVAAHQRKVAALP